MTWPEFLAANYSKKVAAAYGVEVSNYLTWLGGEAAALTADYGQLVGYLSLLRSRYEKVATVRAKFAAIKTYHRYLLESGQRKDHPGLGLRLRSGAVEGLQLQDMLSEAELSKLLEGREQWRVRLVGRNRVIMGLLVHQALTIREVGLLEVGDVDLVKGLLNVRGINQTRARKLKLTTPQIMQLYTYINEDRPRLIKMTTKRLILTSRGTVERGQGVQYLVEGFRPSLPDRRLTATVIRQSVVALKLKQGKGLRQVQAFAGHKWVSTTEAYRESNLAELRVAVARFHPLATRPNGAD